MRILSMQGLPKPLTWLSVTVFVLVVVCLNTHTCFCFPCELHLETSSQKAHEQAQVKNNSERISQLKEKENTCINVAGVLAGPSALIWKLLRECPRQRISKKSGSATFIPYQVDDNSGVGTQVKAVDLNGDGYPEIVVGNKKGGFVHMHVVKKASKAQWQAAQPKIK